MRPLAPLEGRNRSRAWFAPGATERLEYTDDLEPADKDWFDIKTREEMFIPIEQVTAHLMFGLVSADMGGRVSLTRLQAIWEDEEDTWPRLIEEPVLRVDYLNLNLNIAVVTDEAQSKTETIRLDSITEIAATVKPTPT